MNVPLDMRVDLTPSVLNNSNLQGSNSVTTDKQLSFEEILRDSFNQLNQLQLDADKSIQDMVLGKTDDIHSVMIALQKAQVSLQFAVQVRNKLVEAYQEIMRMQV